MNALAQLGLGHVAYLKAMDDSDISALIPGAVAEPGVITLVLFAADGDIVSFFHTVAGAMIAAAEHGLAIAAVH
jgi:hypothetical protein